MEVIRSRTKIAIKSLTPRSWLLPRRIVAFEFVSEAHALGRPETQRGVIDFEIARPCRQRKIRNRRIIFSVGDNRFNVHRWRYGVRLQMTGIQYLQDLAIHEPQLPI